ncbi:hypothetical protein [Intestinibacter sp.]|uniref:hypothetical protein n=2 Tax=Intestinibacter sp. TaxID=1965304 RepID=UPI003F186CDA
MTTRDTVKLDEILKRLFTTSNKVLIKLLNAIFEENFNPDEVSVSITNSEFIDETLDVLRADMIFKVFEKGNSNFDKNKMNYHIEFQTKNDNTMVIRTFEYGFRKGKENSERIKDGITKLYFGEDFHKMLLAIQNLIEYLNRNYIDDESLEEEVSIMTKTLYDPEVEKRGYEKGKIEGKIEIILNMYSEGLDENQISKLTKVDTQRVQEIIKEHTN